MSNVAVSAGLPVQRCSQPFTVKRQSANSPDGIWTGSTSCIRRLAKNTMVVPVYCRRPAQARAISAQCPPAVGPARHDRTVSPTARRSTAPSGLPAAANAPVWSFRSCSPRGSSRLVGVALCNGEAERREEPPGAKRARGRVGLAGFILRRLPPSVRAADGSCRLCGAPSGLRHRWRDRWRVLRCWRARERGRPATDRRRAMGHRPAKGREPIPEQATERASVMA